MPRLPIYTPETQGAFPHGTVTPELRTVREEGESIENLGRTTMNIGSGLIDRQEQLDRDTAQIGVQSMWDNYTQQMSQGMNDGTFDTTKFLKSFDDDAQSLSDKIQSSRGQEFFQKQISLVKNSLTLRAKLAQAKIAGQNALLTYQDGLNKASSMLETNPSMSQDALKNQLDYIDHMNVSDTAKSELKFKAGKQLALATVNGQMSQGFDAAVSGAQKIIDAGGPDMEARVEKYRQGLESLHQTQKPFDVTQFGSYLDANDANDINNKQRQSETAISNEVERRLKVALAARTASQKDWMDKNAGALERGELSNKQIINSPLTFEQKDKFLKASREAIHNQTEDPTVINDLTKRILAPDSDPKKISDPTDVYSKVGNGISFNSAQNLIKMMDSTPEGRDMKFNRSQLFKTAKSFLVSSGPLGSSDNLGEYHLSQFMRDLQLDEQKFRQEGKDPRELYDPRSKNYFASPENMRRYQPSPDDILNSISGQSAPSDTSAPPNMGINSLSNDKTEGKTEEKTQTPPKPGYVRLKDSNGTTGWGPATLIGHGYTEIK